MIREQLLFAVGIGHSGLTTVLPLLMYASTARLSTNESTVKALITTNLKLGFVAIINLSIPTICQGK